MGCEVAVVAWVAQGRFFHTLEQKSSHCVSIEVHKQLHYMLLNSYTATNSYTALELPQLLIFNSVQFTCQTDTVAETCSLHCKKCGV